MDYLYIYIYTYILNFIDNINYVLHYRIYNHIYKYISYIFHIYNYACIYENRTSKGFIEKISGS